MACTHAILATISSSYLKELRCTRIIYQRWEPESLDSTLIALARLKDTDALLAQPQFSRLHHIQLDYSLNILSSLSTLHILPAEQPALPLGSSSQPGPIDNVNSHNARDAFECEVEGVIRSKTLEKLKQFCDRGELEIKLNIGPYLREGYLVPRGRVARSLTGAAVSFIHKMTLVRDNA